MSHPLNLLGLSSLHFLPESWFGSVGKSFVGERVTLDGSVFVNAEGSLECTFPLFSSSVVVGVLDKILIIKVFFNHFHLHRNIKSYGCKALVQLYFTAHMSSLRWHICFSFCCHYSPWDLRASVISVVEKWRQGKKALVCKHRWYVCLQW